MKSRYFVLRIFIVQVHGVSESLRSVFSPAQRMSLPAGRTIARVLDGNKSGKEIERSRSVILYRLFISKLTERARTSQISRLCP